MIRKLLQLISLQATNLMFQSNTNGKTSSDYEDNWNLQDMKLTDNQKTGGGGKCNATFIWSLCSRDIPSQEAYCVS